MAIHDLEGVSELHSNPFIHRAFALFDTDSDGRLSLQDFTKAIDVLGHLNNSEQQLKCTCPVCPCHPFPPGSLQLQAVPGCAVLFQMFDSDNAGVLDASKLQDGLQTVAGRTLSVDHLHEACPTSPAC